MPDIIITVVSGETTELGLSIPGVQGPIGGDTMPSGGTTGNILVKQSATNYDAAWTSQASGLVLISAVASGTWTNGGTISGGTYTGALFNGGTISGATIASGLANDVAISAALIDASTIDNSSIEDSTIASTTVSGCNITGGTISGTTFSGVITNSQIDNPTVSGGAFSSPIVTSPTFSGAASTGSGLVLGGAADLLAFYGAGAVVQPSGITIPSGGSSLSEVTDVVSGIVVALQNLGLLGV